MISNVDALEILRLHSVEEWPIVAIARHFCCHHSVVRRGIGNSVSARADRKSILAPYFGFILETLEKYPEIHSTRIFAMLKERGFNPDIS